MESDQTHEVVVNRHNYSIITSIKIELEKVTSSSPPPGDGKNNSNEGNTDTINVNTNNMESIETIGGAQVQDYNKTIRNNTVGVPTTEVRYFQGIGDLEQPGYSGRTTESLTGQSSTSIPINHETVKNVNCPTFHTVHTPSGDNPNDFRYPIVKPPTYTDFKYGTVELYAPDTGPRIYNVKGNIISQPIITKNLPEAFRALPVHGKPESKAGLKDFYDQKIRDYVGYGISDGEFKRLQEYMDGEYLQTGLECTTPYNYPSQGPLSVDLQLRPQENGPGQHLCIVKKVMLRVKKDTQNYYPRKLKYRGLRMLPLSIEDDEHMKTMAESTSTAEEDDDGPVEPGRDLIFRARIYRPHSYGSKDERDKKPTRHSVFNNDLVLLGRQRLTAFRDRIACPNDMGMRIDVSDNPDCYTAESAKQIFPSGFLFINNVFYVDTRAGCADHSAGIRDWARRRGLGDFPVRDMGAVRLDQLVLKLGHPEVYMHQGKCEHLFTFSEVRLLGGAEPARAAHYPCYSHISQNQSVYCTTCAEFGAKWVVAGSARVPFDPAFFCDTCFRLYLYDARGNKIGDFKAYAYSGNAVNFIKPVAAADPARPADRDSD